MKKIEKHKSRYSSVPEAKHFSLLSGGDSLTGPPPRFGLPEIFILVQFLSPALFFIPGTQSVRSIIRAVPYLMSGYLLVHYLWVWSRERREKWMMDSASLAEKMKDIPTAETRKVRQISKAAYPFHGMHGWLLGALILMGLVYFFNPWSHPVAGMAQLMYQAMVMAPAFWAVLVVQNQKHMTRLLVLAFLCNFASAGFGMLQIYFPGKLDPPQYTQVAPELQKTLTYQGADGKSILRPSGLTDVPGGAAAAGLFTGFLGMVLFLTPGFSWLTRIMFLIGGGLGPMTLLMTHVRSMFMVMTAVIFVFAGILFIQRRLLQFQLLTGTTIGIGIAAFIYAVALGGESTAKRFDFLTGKADVEVLASERGKFHEKTFTKDLQLYPFGAGMGRWGVMAMMFNREQQHNLQPLYVEVQVTGWLYDGGMLLWLLYPLAIVFATVHLFKASLKYRQEEISYIFGIVFAMSLSTVAMCYASAPFNTQYGIVFWFFAAGGIGLVLKRKNLPDPEESGQEISFADRRTSRFHRGQPGVVN